MIRKETGMILLRGIPQEIERLKKATKTSKWPLLAKTNISRED